MEMSTQSVFEKTGKGADELKTRRHGLSPRLRQLLILVDGKRDLGELARMLPGPDLVDQLGQLERGGFVARPLEAFASRPEQEPAPTAEVANERAAPAVEDLRALRARVARALIDTIGPNGDELAMRIERTRSVDELQALLPAVLSVVEACGGRTGVDAFLQRGGAM